MKRKTIMWTSSRERLCHHKNLRVGLALCAGLFVTSGAYAVPYSINNTSTSTDFSSFTDGESINQYDDEAKRGQTWSADDEWVGSPADFDEGVTTSGGDKVWRLSDIKGSGGFAGQPWSPSVVPVGEPGSHLWNDRGSEHSEPLDPPNENGSPQRSVYDASFKFKSATDATQDGLFMSVSPGPRQSALRQSWIGLDGGNGGGTGTDGGKDTIDISFFETVADGNDSDSVADFKGHTVKNGLDPSVFHTVRIKMTFKDGLSPDGTGNDEVTVYVDGQEELTGVSTWESYYETNPSFSDTPQVAVDSLLFNLDGSQPGTADTGKGFLFDDFQAEGVPEPASLALLGFGTSALLGRRRRRA
jgi:hypothetical protein